MPTVRDAVLDALAVVAPVDCAGCGIADRAVCGDCRREVVPAVHAARLSDAIPVVSALVYRDRVRRIILAVKEQGRTDVLRHLAPAMRAAVLHAVSGEVEVTCVPGSRAGFRRRGYDPVRMLLRTAGLPSGPSVLRQVRRTRAQKTLLRDDRDDNLAGSMLARRTLGGRRFVLVDDVLTTGATLREAARAIEHAGGTVVAAATLASTPLRSRPHLRHDGHLGVTP